MRRTDESESSSWPTPNAMNSQEGETPETWRARQAEMRARGYNGNGCGTPLAMAVQVWPTPTESDSGGAGNRNLPGSKAHPGTSLTDAVSGGQAPRSWPSPQAHDDKNFGEANPGHSPQLRHSLGLLAPERFNTSGSRRGCSVVLNPAWVSCLMGFPPDWCDIGDVPLPRSATPSSRKLRKSSRGQQEKC